LPFCWLWICDPLTYHCWLRPPLHGQAITRAPFARLPFAMSRHMLLTINSPRGVQLKRWLFLPWQL